MLSGTYPSYGQTTLEGIMLPMTTGSLSVAKQKQKLFSIIIATMQAHTHTDGHIVHITMLTQYMYIHTYTDSTYIHTDRQTVHTYIHTHRQTNRP